MKKNLENVEDKINIFYNMLINKQNNKKMSKSQNNNNNNLLNKIGLKKKYKRKKTRQEKNILIIELYILLIFSCLITNYCYFLNYSLSFH